MRTGHQTPPRRYPRRSLPALWFSIALACAGCDGSTRADDQAYADQLVARELHAGMPLTAVREFLAHHDAAAVLQRGCGLGPHRQTSCAYSTVATVALPGRNWWLGSGDLEISMIFDEEKDLLAWEYRLSYPGGDDSTVAPP